MKLSKLVAVLVVVLLSFGMGERCAAQNDHVYLETAVGMADTGSEVYHQDACFPGGVVKEDIFTDTARIRAHEISYSTLNGLVETFRPTKAGIFQDTFAIVWTCSYARGPNNYLYSSVLSTAIAHSSGFAFISPSWRDSLHCNYEVDSERFGSYFPTTVWNPTTAPFRFDSCRLILVNGFAFPVGIIDSVQGKAVSFLILAPNTLSNRLLLHLTIPDTLADSTSPMKGRLVFSTHSSFGDSLLELPVTFVLNPAETYGALAGKRELDFNLATNERGNDSVDIMIDGIIRGITLDSLPRPLHCYISRVFGRKVWVKVWMEGSPAGRYWCDLHLHYSTLSPFRQMQTNTLSVPIRPSVQFGKNELRWEPIAFQTNAAPYSFASSMDGADYFFNNGAYRLLDDGLRLDTLFLPKVHVMKLNPQNGGVITAIVHSPYLGPEDPNYQNEIRYSNDTGRHWRVVAAGPLTVDSSTPLPLSLYGYSPIAALKEDDSSYLAILSGLINVDSFLLCPARSTDGGASWFAITNLQDWQLVTDPYPNEWLEQTATGNFLIGGFRKVDTLFHGSFILQKAGLFLRRFPNGDLLFLDDSEILHTNSLGTTFMIQSSPFGLDHRQAGACAVSDLEYLSLNSDREIFHTVDGGVSWQYFNPTILSTVSSMDISLSGRAYAATGDYIYRSKDLFPSAFRGGSQSVANEATLNGSRALLHAYPNPASSVLTVEGSESLHRVELYNILGQRLPVDFKIMNSGLRAVADLHDATEGIYVVRIDYASGVKSLMVRIAK